MGDQIPQREDIARRWQLEKLAALAGPAFRIVGLVALLLMAALWFFPASFALLAGALSAMGAVWLLAIIALAVRFFRKPSTSALTKRADAVLHLPDDLLCTSELPDKDQASQWGQAALENTRQRLAAIDLKTKWPVRWSRATVFSAVAAILLSAVLGWQSLMISAHIQANLSREKAEQQARVAAAEEVLQDWKEFVERTDDEELKKLFSEAAGLREAMQDKDPMTAMLEMNRLEEQMTRMQETIDKQSLAPQAASMAEAFEAFEGMSAMSAALRNQNFEAAATEAEKLAQKMAANPDDRSAVRRNEAVAEMLANESKNSSGRGNQKLSEALSQMSQAAAQSKKEGSVPNSQLSSPTKSLQNQFAQQCQSKNRGRAMSLGKEQLQALRARLRSEKESNCELASSLCGSCLGNGNKPGGLKAGNGTGGPPQGDETKLAEAAVQENVSGVAGEGETEKTTTSASTGAGTTTAAAKPTAFSDYAELSQQAVADENLPLAHRRVIRTYFERIRPVAENQKP